MKNILFIIFLIITNFLSAEPRHDSLNVVNKRNTNIMIKYNYLNISSENSDYWNATLENNEGIQIEIFGRIDVPHKDFDKNEIIVKPNEWSTVFTFLISPNYEIDKEKHIYGIDVVNSIPFVKKLKSIFKYLLIYDNENKLIYSLENANERDFDLSYEGSGTLYIYEEYSLYIK